MFDGIIDPNVEDAVVVVDDAIEVPEVAPNLAQTEPSSVKIVHQYTFSVPGAAFTLQLPVGATLLGFEHAGGANMRLHAVIDTGADLQARFFYLYRVDQPISESNKMPTLHFHSRFRFGPSDIYVFEDVDPFATINSLPV